MDITSAAVNDGVLDERFGCNGQDFAPGDMPSRSFPLEIVGAPAGTASFAVIFDDPDSVPVCGFKWVHWLVTGLKTPKLPEDASRESDDIVQGVNSWYGRDVFDINAASRYGGPYPPDKVHTYVITVLALDFVPVLRTGFTYEDLEKVTKGHVLAKATLKCKYPPKYSN